MSLLAREARGDKGAHDLKRKLIADDARSQTEHVAVIMLARLMRRVCVAAERSPHAAYLIRRDRRADAAPTDDDAYLRLAALYRTAYSERIVWIIIRHTSVVRAEVFYL